MIRSRRRLLIGRPFVPILTRSTINRRICAFPTVDPRPACGRLAVLTVPDKIRLYHRFRSVRQLQTTRSIRRFRGHLSVGYFRWSVPASRPKQPLRIFTLFWCRQTKIKPASPTFWISVRSVFGKWQKSDVRKVRLSLQLTTFRHLSSVHTIGLALVPRSTPFRRPMFVDYVEKVSSTIQ